MDRIHRDAPSQADAAAFEELEREYRLDFHHQRSLARRVATFDWSTYDDELGWGDQHLEDASPKAQAVYGAVVDRIGEQLVRLLDPADARPLSFGAPVPSTELIRLLVDVGNEQGIEVRMRDSDDLSPARVTAVVAELLVLFDMTPEINITAISFEGDDPRATWWATDHEMCVHIDQGLVGVGGSGAAHDRLRADVVDGVVVATSLEPAVGELQRAFGTRLALDLQRRSPELWTELDSALSRVARMRPPIVSMLWSHSGASELPGAEAARESLVRRWSATAGASASGLLSELLVLGRDPHSEDVAATDLMEWITSSLPRTGWDTSSARCVA